VLATVVLVSIAGVAGVLAVREQRAAVETAVDVEKARMIAQSGLELAESRLQNTSAWRTGIASGKLISDQPFASGTFSVLATDPVDDDLTDSTQDDLVLAARGVHGSATQIYRARFKPTTSAYDSLSVSAYAGTNILFSSCTLRAYGIVGCGGTAAAVTSNIYADVEAGVLAGGTTYRQSVKSLAATRTVPSAADALAPYLAMGTEINHSSLPNGGEIKDLVLGPGVNPFGDVNAAGVYYINCGNQSVTIRDARISGTLVLVNAGSGSKVYNSALLEASTTGYPALLVDGDFTIALDAFDLTEGSANMNPAGVPYRGTADNDKNDKYPSMINGMVYVSGNLTIEHSSTIYGPVLSRKAMTIRGSPVLYPVTPNPTPPGFSSAGGFVMVSGSFTRSSD